MSGQKKTRCDMKLTSRRGGEGCGAPADFVVLDPTSTPGKTLFVCPQHLSKAVRALTPAGGPDVVIRVMVLKPSHLADPDGTTSSDAGFDYHPLPGEED